jgi:hypothetical protein
MTAESGDRELNVLLELLGRTGYLIHQFQYDDQYGPATVAAVRNYGGIADVVILVDAEHAVAYRTPVDPDTDVFAPAVVCWSYAACPVWTLRALLTLALPGHPDAPAALGPAPPGIGLPAEARMPARVRRRQDQGGVPVLLTAQCHLPLYPA